MKARIEPGRIDGVIKVPASKSITQRVYAAALLFADTTLIKNAGCSADEMAALHIIQQLGAEVVHTDGCITVKRNATATVGNSIYCGESGLAARLFTPIVALQSHGIEIRGSGSLLHRPMEGVAEVLTALGVHLPSFSGSVPFTVHGPLLAKSVSVTTTGSSQLLSGLLFALCASTKEPLTITVGGLKSKPYIDLTLDVLSHFGRPVSHKRYKEFFIDPLLFEHTNERAITVEADWSGAACMLVAGAIAGNVSVPNLSIGSMQADRVLIDILKEAGATVLIDASGISVSRGYLKAFEFDASDCPDLFPALAVLATFCEGESRISGIHRLFGKESNRVESIAEMLWKYSVRFSIEDDALCIEGWNGVDYTTIDGYNDHRIVMAAAVCALRAKGKVAIVGAEAVNKSYPSFFEDLQKCGVNCELAD